MDFVFYFHVLAATVWVGGMIVVASLVPAVRKATDDRGVVRVIARRFGVVSWAALSVSVLTGTWMILDRVWTTNLVTKIALVVVSALISIWHAFVAKDQTPRMRGMVEGLLLVLGLVIVALATTL